MQAIDDFLEYGLWIGSLQEKLAGQARPFIPGLVVGPLEQSDNSGGHAVTNSRVEVAPADDDVVCYRVHRVLPNRDGSFNSPRSLPLIVLSIISIQDRFEGIAFTILFPCIIINGFCTRLRWL
jgi:hypothetical protein